MVRHLVDARLPDGSPVQPDFLNNPFLPIVDTSDRFAHYSIEPPAVGHALQLVLASALE
jgi:hypothetical protein